eukprot:TRINITY_DN13067_c0_g1_i1.p1 TRINITY_DN13067_c0_g1~~TRINITY_DN13067_c0_g1_i1.p1  ORF type:complete len:148 (+),score=33.38 TRINITY_DN13067_c0_g1_i1:51-494(+)
MSVTGSMIAMEEEVWPESCVKDISGELVTTQEGKVSQWEGSTTVGPGEGGAVPSCVSLNKDGDIPTFQNQYKEESKTDLLKEHVNNIASKYDSKKNPVEAVRTPSASNSVPSRMPDKSKSPLSSGTYDACYDSLLAVLSKYNSTETP